MGNYPLPQYHFKVEWGGTNTSFAQVTGLCIENEVITYRDGSSPGYNSIKMPGMRKYSNIVLKRGVVKGDLQFYQWMKTINHNTVERRDVVISLLNEAHEPVMTWKVHKAWPCKIQAPDLNATGNEVALETIELAHEGLELLE